MTRTSDPAEWAEDVCRVCGTHLGQGIRAMHVGICETCAEPLAVGHAVEAGDPGTEDYDYGRILSIDGDEATVAWRGSATRTTAKLTDLRRKGDGA